MSATVLTEYDRNILAVLDTQGGVTTAEVARQVTQMFGDRLPMSRPN